MHPGHPQENGSGNRSPREEAKASVIPAMPAADPLTAAEPMQHEGGAHEVPENPVASKPKALTASLHRPRRRIGEPDTRTESRGRGGRLLQNKPLQTELR